MLFPVPIPTSQQVNVQVNPRKEDLTACHHYTQQWDDRQENISASRQKLKVTEDPISSTDVKTVGKTVGVPEYRLVSERSTFGDVKSIDDKTTDIMEF